LLSGYVALSQEILWYRLLAYATGGAPSAFAYLLSSFLLGLALGSLFAEAVRTRVRLPPALTLGALFLASALLNELTPPATAQMFQHGEAAGSAYAYFSVALVGFPGGVLFPLLCHSAIPAEDVGVRLSRLYLANVVGSILGPLLTTFVLMDVLPLDRLVAVVTGVALAAAAISVFTLPASGRSRAVFLATLGLAGATMAITHLERYELILERLHFKEEFSQAHPYRRVVQTRSGVIAVGGPESDATLYGGGVYDGAFSLDPVTNINGIHRALLVPALHGPPARVLVIGLASGSWAQMLAHHPAVKSIDAVEINPGYLEIIRQYPTHASLLDDPRVRVHIDDGRRWLMRHSDERFDFILMNTTFHWRSHATDLLSEEFFRICREHLNPGGSLMANTTGAQEVSYTMARVFEHVALVHNNVAGSDAPFDLSTEQKELALRGFSFDGTPLLSGTPEREAVMQSLLATPLEDQASALRARTDLQTVTDDNMVTEYKIGRAWINPDHGWAALWKRLP
jgi:spermidine synthase